MTEISLEGLEILEYMRLAEKFSESAVLPMPTDRLIRAGEVAKILEVNTKKISEYADKKILKKFYVDGSSHSKFWLSDVKALAKEVI